ncbi:hypothetical protein ATY36_02405 [Vibrio cidicii]|nr:hypothetical protein ATY36_02405 [Vibrio cidicii]
MPSNGRAKSSQTPFLSIGTWVEQVVSLDPVYPQQSNAGHGKSPYGAFTDRYKDEKIAFKSKKKNFLTKNIAGIKKRGHRTRALFELEKRLTRRQG